MKKPLGYVLLAGLLACAGCFTAAPPPLDAPPQAPTQAAKSFPPVTPEQITDKNGHQVAQALEDEINREVQQNMLTTMPR
jgi:hypothetical protein